VKDARYVGRRQNYRVRRFFAAGISFEKAIFLPKSVPFLLYRQMILFLVKFHKQPLKKTLKKNLPFLHFGGKK